MNKEFKSRLNKALELLREDFELIQPNSQRLFTPVFEKRTYRWAIAMDSDGLLAAERRIVQGEATQPNIEKTLCVGVVIQFEYTTSNTKPNPFGKAAVNSVPLGLWFDAADGRRVRMDRVHVLFILPEYAAPKYRKQFETVKRNVMNAASATPDVEIFLVKRRWGKSELAKRLGKRVRKWLKGVGRPKVAA